MKKTTLLTAAIAAASTVFAQSDADYQLTLSKFQRYYNNNQSDSAFNLFSDKIKAMTSPDKTKSMFGQLSMQFGNMESFAQSKKEEQLAYYKTVFSKTTMTLVVALDKNNKLDNFRFIPYKDEQPTTQSNFQLKTGSGTLFGTLTMPDNANKKVPVVMIIAGSGPTDRDGNNPMGVKGNSYILLADALKNEGIATLRYDKRGIGASAAAVTKEDNITFNTMVNDAEGIAKQLKKDDRFSEVVILGHSEGSLIGMIAAEKVKADKYISIAGISERADKIIEQQLGEQSKDMAAKAKIVLDSLVAGHPVKYIDPDLSNMFRQSVMPYMISWLQYDPKKEIRKLTMKTLIIQGTNDIQVGTAEAEALKKADPSATLKLIPGMNHIFKTAPADRQQNLATYADPQIPLNADLAPAIVHFVKS